MRCSTRPRGKNRKGLTLESLAVERLSGLDKSRAGIIRFPDVFEKICSSLQMPKQRAWELLFSMREYGYIEIVPYQGVRILE